MVKQIVLQYFVHLKTFDKHLYFKFLGGAPSPPGNNNNPTQGNNGDNPTPGNNGDNPSPGNNGDNPSPANNGGNPTQGNNDGNPQPGNNGTGSDNGGGNGADSMVIGSLYKLISILVTSALIFLCF